MFNVLHQTISKYFSDFYDPQQGGLLFEVDFRHDKKKLCHDFRYISD